MFKSVLFQLHWFLGITAGTVLALMGLTGASLSFEDELLRALNPPLANVAAQHAQGRTPLALDELLPRVSGNSSTPLQRLRVDATGKRTSVARFEGGRDHWVYFDPYTGQTLGTLRGQAFFDLVEDIHRHLAAGRTGQLVTGTCAIFLVFFALSGFFLRWPRRWWHWRTWLVVDWNLRGRSFLWSLHSIVGTWMLPVYLLIALTGLSWSFEWYSNGLQRLIGGARLAPAAVASGSLDLSRVQAQLYQLPGVRHGFIDLRLPRREGQAVDARVRSIDSPHHDRAIDVLRLDPGTGAVLAAQPYADATAGQKVYSSMFALHSGSFFGLVGRVVVMLSSLAMVLFFVTGWMLYLDRRRKKRAIAATRQHLVPAPADGPAWLVSFASQSGQAERLAWHTAAQLQSAGLPVQVQPLAQVDGRTLQGTARALFVLSTFGDGDAPDSARVFERKVLAQACALPGLDYAMLALGDRQYARFCGFARRVETWLGGQGATALFPSVDVDGDDGAAVQHWHQQLAQLTGGAAEPLTLHDTPLQTWTLSERTLLNAGSQGGAIWQITLTPGSDATWQAGDILHVAPRHGLAHVDAVLRALGLDGHSPVQLDGHTSTLREAAAGRVLLQAPQGAGFASPEAWLQELPKLPLREYSIASCSADGVVELVVRLTHDAHGQAGLGSGWLCLHAALHSEISARVRRNRSFHRRDDGAPMILIGNGTGIAGLRGLLREAEHVGHRGHWLLFGERQQAHDALYDDELRRWEAQGHLLRLDRAYSRDGGNRVYVQDLLRTASAELRHWIAEGACVHVCGSLQGMAQGVDDVLRECLGEEAVEQLQADGRYRRDVY